MSDRNVLNAEAILAAADLAPVWVDVPEWGGGVYVRAMSGVERDAFDAELAEGGPDAVLTNIRARLVARCASDAEGARVFQDSDIPALGEKSGAALDRVFTVAQRLNRLTEASIASAEGNSAPDLNG